MPVLNNSFFCGSGGSGEVIYSIDAENITLDSNTYSSDYKLVVNDANLTNFLFSNRDKNIEIIITFERDYGEIIAQTQQIGMKVAVEAVYANVEGTEVISSLIITFGSQLKSILLEEGQSGSTFDQYMLFMWTYEDTNPYIILSNNPAFIDGTIKDFKIRVF